MDRMIAVNFGQCYIQYMIPKPLIAGTVFEGTILFLSAA
jgi:hypothetical protein